MSTVAKTRFITTPRTQTRMEEMGPPAGNTKNVDEAIIITRDRHPALLLRSWVKTLIYLNNKMGTWAKINNNSKGLLPLRRLYR
jgi:hypothetical protein